MMDSLTPKIYLNTAPIVISSHSILCIPAHLTSGIYNDYVASWTGNMLVLQNLAKFKLKPARFVQFLLPHPHTTSHHPSIHPSNRNSIELALNKLALVTIVE
jgi:hypothetical protein